MKKLLNWFKNEESGQGMVEYGLIIAAVALVVFVVLKAFGNTIGNFFTNLGNQL